MQPHRHPEYDEAVPLNEVQKKAATQVYPVPNADYVHTIRIAVPVVGALPPAARWIQLPDISVIDDMSLILKAWPVNPIGSLVFVAETAAYTQNPDTSYPLMPNEAVTYRVKNAVSIYVAANVAACWVIVTAEQRR
jgi:hypothetical protein